MLRLRPNGSFSDLATDLENDRAAIGKGPYLSNFT